jgi:hypothetical protein
MCFDTGIQLSSVAKMQDAEFVEIISISLMVGLEYLKNRKSRQEIMITFSCACGKTIRVKDEHAGKKGKCPACRQVVRVPKPEPVVAESAPAGDDFFSKMLEQSYEEQGKAPVEPESQSPAETPPSTVPLNQTGEEIKKRPFPVFIDFFLYPVCGGGLVQMAIYVIVPTVLNVVFGFLLSLLVVIVSLVIALYTYWYICECVRDSASGGIRAPDILSCMPDFGEVFMELLRILGCLILFVGSPLVYLYMRGIDAGFWILTISLGAIFPMALLAIIMFGSIAALNPVLLIASICSSFVEYIPTVLLVWLVVAVKACVQRFLRQSIGLELIGDAVFMYGSMLSAHILGRFFYRNSERLNWEV